MKSLYLKHDSDCHDDFKVRRLIKKYGMAGYGLYWILLELMRDQEDGYFCLDDIDIICDIARLDEDEAGELIDYMLSISLFVKDGNRITSERLQRDVEENRSLSEKNRANAQKKWRKQRQIQCDGNAVAMRSQCGRNASAEQVQCKEEEEEEEEIKEKNNTSTPNVVDEKKKVAELSLLLLNDGSKYTPTEDEVKGFRDAFPTLDIRQEFFMMSNWCEANPSKRKSRKGIKTFIANWLARSLEDQKARKSTVSTSQKTQQPRGFGRFDLGRKPTAEDLAKLSAEVRVF